MTVKELNGVGAGVKTVTFPMIKFKVEFMFEGEVCNVYHTYYHKTPYKEGNGYDSCEVKDIKNSNKGVICYISNGKDKLTEIFAPMYEGDYLRGCFSTDSVSPYINNVFCDKGIKYVYVVEAYTKRANNSKIEDITILREIDYLVKDVTNRCNGKVAILFRENSFFTFVYRSKKLHVIDAMRKDGWVFDDSFTRVYKIMEV